MALKGKLEKRTEDGKEKEIFVAEFTNSTVDQLKELALFLEADGFDLGGTEDEKLKKVIETGIAWLERIKERKSEEKAKISPK